MIQRYDTIPSTAKGLLQAQDAIHHHLQANLHELRVLVAQQHVGYTELDDIGRRLREIQDAGEIKGTGDGEDAGEDEVDEIDEDSD